MKEKIQEIVAARRKNDEQGFTLMEMLIVVAIIAILIAIAIPVFTSQLENSREATDAANLRSAYAVAAAKVVSDGGNTGVAAGPVAMKQTQSNWTSGVNGQKIGGTAITEAPTSGNVYVNVATDGTVSFTSNAGASGFTTVDPINGTEASSGNSGSGNGGSQG